MGTCVEFEEQFANSAPSDGVQVTSRLVCKQHSRLRNERTSQRHALLLSTRELSWIVSSACAQPDTPEGLYSRAARLGAARQLQRKHDVLEGGEGWYEMK
jgi:hypothetical protein